MTDMNLLACTDPSRPEYITAGEADGLREPNGS